MNNSLRLLKHTHRLWNMKYHGWFPVLLLSVEWNSCDVVRKMISCITHGRMSDIYLGVNTPVGFQCPIPIRPSCHGKGPTMCLQHGQHEGHCHGHCSMLKWSSVQHPGMVSTWPWATRLLRLHDYRESTLQHRARVGLGAGEHVCPPGVRYSQSWGSQKRF